MRFFPRSTLCELATPCFDDRRKGKVFVKSDGGWHIFVDLNAKTIFSIALLIFVTIESYLSINLLLAIFKLF